MNFILRKTFLCRAAGHGMSRKLVRRYINIEHPLQMKKFCFNSISFLFQKKK